MIAVGNSRDQIIVLLLQRMLIPREGRQTHLSFWRALNYRLTICLGVAVDEGNNVVPALYALTA